MNLKELREIESAAENEKRFKISVARKEYALSNDPHKIGDVIIDHFQTGRIVSKKYDLSVAPRVIYYCEKLTRKGEINKKNPYCYIYQSNLKKI